MRLCALTLQDRERLDDCRYLAFDLAVTATIGPNGSGKSNVFGALFIWPCG